MLGAPVIDLSRYIFDTVRKDEEFILYRGQSSDDGSQVLVLSPAGQHPTPESLKRLEHEYSLKEELHLNWAARPIAIEQHWDRPFCVEDPGGVPLDQLLGQPVDVGLVVASGVSLSVAIESLASARHHPQGYQAGQCSGKLRHRPVLADGLWHCFAPAARAPVCRNLPKFVAGTLAYMAPEQTGRMNRSIDSRSDLYSLGVTLYEMLTGSLPFTASDPMEWVHCHIARQPVPPVERLQECPGRRLCDRHEAARQDR